MAKITKVSRAKQAELPRAREDWMSAGRAASPADRGAATDAVRGLYAELGEPPPLVFWMDSPWRATLASAILHLALRRIAGGARDLHQQLDQQLDQQLYQQLGQQLDQQLGQQLGQQLDQQLYLQFGQQLDQLLDQQLHQQLGQQLDQQLYQQLGQQLHQQLDQQLDQQLYQQLGQQLDQQLGQQLYQQLDQVTRPWRWFGWWWRWGWVAYYDFARRWGVKYDDASERRLNLWCSLLRSANSWIWPLKGAVVLTECPAAIHRDQEGRMHNDAGAAVMYRDGWGVYAIHGVRVTQQIVEQPQSLTVQQIRDERNLEVRRVMLDRFGSERYLRESDAQLICADAIGKLWRVDVEDDEPIVAVEVLNSTPEPDGSRKTYWIRVPPDTRTPKGGIAWSFDVPEELYEPLYET
jgi:hypothetical protein